MLTSTSSFNPLPAHPTVLAIAASGAGSSLCLKLGVAHPTLFHWESTALNQQSEQLLPAIQDLLRQAGIQKPDVIAVDTGPGAFTSVRMAVAVAQGLALGWACPAVVVCSLHALAQGVVENLRPEPAPKSVPKSIAAVLDARMGECYAAVYTHQHGVVTESAPPQLVSYADFAGWACDTHSADHWVGNGAAVIPDWEQAPVQYSNAQPTAADVLAVFQAQHAAGSLVLLGPEALQPVYVRNTVAYTSAERAGQAQRVAMALTAQAACV